MTQGCLYAIGVGPGAPDLITWRAIHILQKAQVVLAASSPGNDYSLAYEIAKPHLPATARIVRLEFPMTREEAVLDRAWQKAADQTLTILKNGQDACFLTLGDPLVYSTFGYLAHAIKNIDQNIKMEIVPGITSFQAACARLGLPLCQGKENLRILSGINSRNELEKELQNTDTAVILKVYRNFQAITDALRVTGRLSDCVLASSIETAHEKLENNLEHKSGRPPYMSLIISKGKTEQNCP